MNQRLDIQFEESLAQHEEKAMKMDDHIANLRQVLSASIWYHRGGSPEGHEFEICVCGYHVASALDSLAM